jgi:hypothetical protein
VPELLYRKNFPATSCRTLLLPSAPPVKTLPRFNHNCTHTRTHACRHMHLPPTRYRCRGLKLHCVNVQCVNLHCIGYDQTLKNMHGTTLALGRNLVTRISQPQPACNLTPVAARTNYTNTQITAKRQWNCANTEINADR